MSSLPRTPLSGAAPLSCSHRAAASPSATARADLSRAAARQRRLLLEALEPRSMPALLALAADPTVFDTASPAPNSEVENLAAELSLRGHTLNLLSDLSAAGLTAALSAADALVIPKQQLASLASSLSAAAADVLRSFVESGHGLIVTGSPSGRAESLLSGLFGFSIPAGNNPFGAALFKSENAVGTAFAGGPGALNISLPQVSVFDILNYPAGFPAGTRLLYTSGSVATVSLFPFGQGQVVYLGYDFDNTGHVAATNWKTVLGLAVDQVAVAPPTTSIELSAGGDLVIADLAGGNDRFTLSANEHQWSIVLDSGLVTMPTAIAGVTTDDQTITIVKSLATGFTGSFNFLGGGGNDVLHINLPEVEKQVHFDGGADDDVLEVASAEAMQSIFSSPDAFGGGTIQYCWAASTCSSGNGGYEVSYANVGSVDLTGVLVSELHLDLPQSVVDAELTDYLAPTDGLSQLRFADAVADQFFHRPDTLLAIHTAGDSQIKLDLVDPVADVPQLVLQGAANDLFRLHNTFGIRSGTSLTLLDGTLDLNGQSPIINGLSGDGAITNSADTHSLLTLGAAGADGSFAGSIGDGWPLLPQPALTRQVALVKAGAGTQTFGGIHTFSGSTVISGGTLVLNGALSPHSNLTVESGATLSGTGAVQAGLLLRGGGILSPGFPAAAPGRSTGQNETWQADSRLVVQIGGPLAGNEHDQRRVQSLTLEDSLLEVTLLGGFLPTEQPPLSLTIVDNQGTLPIAGVFLGLPEGAAINLPGSPVPVFISYQGGDGNDLVLFTAGDMSQLLGTSGDDTIVLRRQAAGAGDTQLEYSLNGGAFVPLDDVESLTIEAGDGADVIVLDFVHGDPVPPQGLELIGGDAPQASLGDRLVMVGDGHAGSFTYDPGSAADQGAIVLAGDHSGTIELASLEAIDATLFAHARFATPLAGSEIHVADATDAGSGVHAALRIWGSSGSPSVPLHVWSVEKLTLDTTAGDDDMVLFHSATGPHWVGELELVSGTGSDLLTVAGPVATAGNISLQSGRIVISGPIAAGGALDITSHGLLSIAANVTATGPIRLTTTDAPGLDADLAIEAAVQSVAGGITIQSADSAIVRGPLAAASTIDMAVDVASFDPGEGDAVFLQAALSAPGGTTVRGNADADRFEIQPQSASALLILGELPAAALPGAPNAAGGNEPGDRLILDMTTSGDGTFVAGPVAIDTVGGSAVAANTRPIAYRGIESLDLYDEGSLTTAEQGDFYLRGTEAADYVFVHWMGDAQPSFRVSVGGLSFPAGGYFGPYQAGRAMLVYAGGGSDVVQLGAVPLAAKFFGQAGDDYLSGGRFSDLLVGGAGRDTLHGGSVWQHHPRLPLGDELWGDDFDPLVESRGWWSQLSRAGDGPDSLTASGGQDQLYGQGGDDGLYAADGNDYLSGGGGHDRLGGGGGDDRLYGDGGNDTLVGDGGHDLLVGGEGNDVLLGGLGNDLLIGGLGADALHGNDGDDALWAGQIALAAADEPAAADHSAAAGDASDAALLALLLDWALLGELTGATRFGEDGASDWLYGNAGRDRFVGDATAWHGDLAAGVDEAG